MKTLQDVEVEMDRRGYRLIAIEAFPGWGITWRGGVIVGPVSYEDAEEEMLRLHAMEVRSCTR